MELELHYIAHYIFICYIKMSLYVRNFSAALLLSLLFMRNVTLDLFSHISYICLVYTGFYSASNLTKEGGTEEDTETRIANAQYAFHMLNRI
jgi:hypothetical protein